MLATSAPILSTGFSRRDRLGLAATPKHVDMEMPFYHDDTLTLALFSPVPLVSAPMSPVQIPPPLHTSTPLPQSTVESPSPSDNQMNPTEDLRNNPNSRNQNSQINRQRTTISRIGLTLNLDQPALDLTTRFCPNETTSTTVPNTHTTTAALPSKKQTARTLTTGSVVDDVAVLILGTTEDESNLTIVPNPWLDMNSEVKATNEAEALPCLGISGPTSDECTLTSPDLGLLKLASPELERLVLASAHSVFSTVSTPTSTVHVGTHEQEGFAAGFMLALAELQEKTTSEDGRMMGVSTEEELDSMPSVGPALESVRPGNPQNSSSGEAQNCNLATQASLLNLNRDRQSVKEEPQRVPEAGEYVHREDESCSRKGPLLSPPARERARAERKRLRNRVAASKCRKKKLERIARLEEKVKDLRSQNGELVAVAGALRRQVAALKQRVMYHVTSGCHLILSQQLEPH